MVVVEEPPMNDTEADDKEEPMEAIFGATGGVIDSGAVVEVDAKPPGVGVTIRGSGDGTVAFHLYLSPGQAEALAGEIVSAAELE